MLAYLLTYLLTYWWSPPCEPQHEAHPSPKEDPLPNPPHYKRPDSDPRLRAAAPSSALPLSSAPSRALPGSASSRSAAVAAAVAVAARSRSPAVVAALAA